MVLTKFDIHISNVDGISTLPKIELTTGIITLTGKNNVGKSRILRNIDEFRSIVLGERPEGNINNLELSVSSEINDGDFTLNVNIDRKKKSFEFVSHRGNDYNTKVLQEGYRVQIQISPGGPFRTTSSSSIHTAASFHNDFYVLQRNLERIVYVPPYRPIADKANTSVETTILPNGKNLGEILYYHKNSETKQFHEIEKVMRETFTEIENILTVPSGNNEVTITIKDRFTGKNVPISEAGTGVAQTLLLTAMIICSEPGRIFLIDEPHVYLHPNAEKALARFIREHTEHYYIIATHSTLLISQLKPDVSYLVTRDKDGTKMRSLFTTAEDREEVFAELGLDTSDMVLFESLIFVEGSSDKAIYEILFDKLGLDELKKKSTIVDISGAGTSEPIETVLDRLDSILNIPHVIILDGDQKGKKNGTHVRFLPYNDIEDVLLLDTRAVLRAITKLIGDKANKSGMTEEEVSKFVEESQRKGDKGVKILNCIFQSYDTHLYYSKRKHGPMIAELLDPKK